MILFVIGDFWDIMGKKTKILIISLIVIMVAILGFFILTEKVTDSPDDFYKSRNNGESLVHDYVVGEIARSEPDLVIIGHDHEPGYGEGYYIATPTMDNESVELAEEVTGDIGFNHYKRNKTQPTKSTSIRAVDNPIVDTGTMLFVYEIPETDTKAVAFIESYRLLEASYNHLLNQ